MYLYINKHTRLNIKKLAKLLAVLAIIGVFVWAVGVYIQWVQHYNNILNSFIETL